MPLDQQLIGRLDGLRFGPIGLNWVHLCIDMQRMFAEATPWQAEWMPRVLPNVVRLVERDPARTVFTRFVPPRSASDMAGAWRRYYQRWEQMTLERLDPALVDIVPSLAKFQPPARILDKPVYSPWYDGQLRAALAAQSVDTLIVSGTETEVCVLATVLGAIDAGFRTIVATDAVCSSADQTHDAMMAVYHSRFGMQVETSTTEEILAGQ
jgi:nicotinamidase-related amidase